MHCFDRSSKRGQGWNRCKCLAYRIFHLEPLWKLNYIFEGKLLSSALKPLRRWHEYQPQKRENAAAHDFVDKSLWEERRPRLNKSALINFVASSDLLHTSGPFVGSRRFIDESSRKSEILISPLLFHAGHCKCMSRKTSILRDEGTRNWRTARRAKISWSTGRVLPKCILLGK